MGFEKPTTKYIDVKLQKDLHDNEDICPTCGGLGLMIANNPYGLSNDPDKTFSNLFPSKGSKYKDKPVNNQNYGAFDAADDSRAGSTEKYPTSILSFQKPHPSVAKHRTEKPVALLEYLIKTYTNENETVLDNCMGCGSTGVACTNTNRNFIGMELDEDYFLVAQKNIYK